MIALLFLAMFTAVAAEIDLDIERGRADLEAHRTEDARVHALSALGEDPQSFEAYRLYLDVMLTGGLGPKGLADTAGLEISDPPWSEAVKGVRQALDAGDAKNAVLGIREIQKQWPNRPDLLDVLWSADDVVGKVVRERARLVDLISFEAEKKADAVYAFRARRFLMSVGADAEPAAKALTDLGEEYTTSAGAMRRHDRSETARRLAKEEAPELPHGEPDDMLDISERLSKNLLIGGKGAVAVDMWVRFRSRHESAAAAIGHATALIEIKDFEGALSVADEALVLAVDPSARDLAGILDKTIREQLAAALLVRAAAWEGMDYPASAMVDLTVANQLHLETMDDVMEERIRKSVVANTHEVRERHGGSEPASRAIEKARKVAEIDPKAAMASLGDAIFLYCAPTRTNTTAFSVMPWLSDLAVAYGLQAQLFNKLSTPDRARVAATLATLLMEGGDARVWRARAELHEEAGHTEAAFASWATARGLHASADPFDYESALKRNYTGSGDWSEAAGVVAQVMERPAEAGQPSVRVYRKAAIYRTPGHRKTSTSLAAARVTAPVIGQPVPPWSAQAETGGTIDSASLKGRTVILTFWASYCETCLQMLPELNTLARQLRKEGHDVAVVGVSVDDDRRAFKTVERIGQRWGQLIYSPELAVRFGVAALPSTWIVDARGNVRYFVDTWAGSRHFGRQIRRVIVE